MKVLVIPDTGALDYPGLDRIVKAVRARFGADAEIVLGLEPAQLSHSSVAVANLPMMPVRDALSQFDTWLLALSFLPIFHGEGGWERVKAPGNASTRAGKQIFAMEPDGYIHPLRVALDGSIDASMRRSEDAHIERNVFVRMGTRNFRGAAYFFPYNGYYCVHPAAFGPIDEFGFRHSGDLRELENRDKDHIVIVVLGGSSAFSPCCLYDEMFSTVLERKLQAHRDAGHSKLRFTVVNLATSGNTVLNEVFTWILFCHRLRPDIVIAHDLFNDLAHGIQTDPDLLNRYDITYLPALEEWGRRLMGAEHVPLTQSDTPGAPIGVVSSPHAVARAYLARKRQLMGLVLSAGGHFVWGVQPAWFCKRPSPAEAARFEKIRRLAPQNMRLYESLPLLYSLVRKNQNVPPDGTLVDVHGLFDQFGEEDTLFVDHAHLTPLGDEHVAQLYFAAIAEQILPKLQARAQ